MAAAAVCLCSACEGVARLALRYSRCCQALGTCEADGAGTPGCSCYGTRHVLAGLKGTREPACCYADVVSVAGCSAARRPHVVFATCRPWRLALSSAIQQSCKQQTLL